MSLKAAQFIIVFILMTTSSFAQEFGSAFVSKEQTSSNQAPRGLWFWLGGDIGYMMLETDVSSEDSKTGIHYDAKADAAIYFSDDFMMDLGGGWQYERLARERANGSEIVVNSRAGFAELSPRYRLSGDWNVGPAVQYSFGSDLSLSETVGDESTLWLLGARAAYEPKLGSATGFRLNFQFLTDLDAENRQAYIGMIGIQFGFGVTDQGGSDKKFVYTQKAPALNDSPVAASFAEEPPTLTRVFEEEFIHFDFDRADLKPYSLRFVTALGQFLAKNDQAWSSLIVEGHADIRGTYEYNIDLSKRRAQAVIDALIRAGVPKYKLKEAAYGFTRPVDDRQGETAWAKNRRVEFKFMGDTNTDLINRRIDEIRARFSNIRKSE